MSRIGFSLTVLLSSILFLGIQVKPAHADPVAGESRELSYAGIEQCKLCHTDQYESYSKSVHGMQKVSGSPASRYGCESCHGQGSTHVSNGGGKGIMLGFRKTNDGKERESKCLSCHSESRHLMFWDNGRHKAEGVVCDDCHSIHGNGSLEKSLKKAQPDLCLDCHKRIRMLNSRQSHHPLAEGKVKCTDCHNPHGGFGDKMIKADSVNELCYGCHAEKRGPFRIEHPPVVENCALCHEMHGSNQMAMLVRKAPQLCQECHLDNGAHAAGTPYSRQNLFSGSDPRSQLVGRACLNCHTNIHGSNSDAAFTR